MTSQRSPGAKRDELNVERVERVGRVERVQRVERGTNLTRQQVI